MFTPKLRNIERIRQKRSSAVALRLDLEPGAADGKPIPNRVRRLIALS
jgi:hypothetical protein